MSEENKAISRRFIEAFNAGDYDTITSIVADGYVSHDPASPEEIRGAAALQAQIEGYRAAFPDLTLTIEQQIAEGDYVASRWTGRGTHRGELLGVAATGRQATATGITIDRIENGKIAETWENWDTLGLLQQLGAIPEPTAATA